MRQSEGFGYDPQREAHHFRVRVGRQDVEVYEAPLALESEAMPPVESMRLRLSRDRWDLIAAALAEDFNRRLRALELRPGKWAAAGLVPVARLLGKELLVLGWAMEQADPGQSPMAIANWQGLAPEERWWLYSMTAAQTGRARDGAGWRKALRYALCENPVGGTREASVPRRARPRSRDHADLAPSLFAGIPPVHEDP